MEEEEKLQAIVQFNIWFMGSNAPASLLIPLREAFLEGINKGIEMAKKKAIKKPAKPVKK